jgi:hypothetical protein
LYIDVTADDLVMLEIPGISGADYEIRASTKVNTVTGANVQSGICLRYSASGVYYGIRVSASSGGIKYQSIKKEPTPPNTSQTTLVTSNATSYHSANTWTRMKGTSLGSNLTFWFETDNKTVTVSDASYSTGTFGLFAGYESGIDHYFKDIIVRKIVAVEPTHGEWGEEKNTNFISMSDTPSIKNQFTISESICGLDNITLLNHITTSDTGTGSEAITSLVNRFSISDSGTITETINYIGSITIDGEVGEIVLDAPDPNIVTGALIEVVTGETTLDGLEASILLGATVIQFTYPTLRAFRGIIR